MSTSQRARRAEVLDTAAAVFASSGYVGTSLKDIADACGIQAGSLYHHFDSKEAIVIELMARFQAEMASIGDAALKSAPKSAPLSAAEDGGAAPADQVVALCTSIAECAFAHRAALQLTFYEPPAGASAELVRLVSYRPDSVLAAMTAILRRAADEGSLAPDVDVALFAEELCEAMRHAGLGVLYRDANAREVAAVLCRLVLDGGPAEPPSDDQLDRSAARLAANAAIRAWGEHDRARGDHDERADRTAVLLSVARTEFARRGYEATTIRDIAAAAGIGTGNVYRFIESKDAMLESIMGAFHGRLSDGYRAVIASDSTTVAKLDALTWLNINILESFPEEFAIQRAWMRAIPPAASNLSALQLERARQIQDIVAEGVRRGELRDGRTGAIRPSSGVLAMCYRDLVWPSSLVKLAGPTRALAHCRATLIRGAATAAAAPPADRGERPRAKR